MDPTNIYDKNNIFAKILRSEIPTDLVYEDEHLIAINDINPVAPFHVLVIAKGEYRNYDEFVNKARPEVVLNYFQKIPHIAKLNRLDEYKIVSNNGPTAGQTIFHFHTHIVGGKNIEWPC